MLYYSNSGNRKEDFINFCKIEKISAGFEKFDFTVPEGARYFALEFLPQNYGALLLDQISFRPEYLEVKRYNVYRDNDLVAAVDARERSFKDISPSLSRHEYRVSAVYTDGESGPSDLITVDLSGVSSSADKGISIHPRPGGLVISHIGGVHVSVVSAAGMMMFETENEDSVDVSLPHGIYLVRVDNRTFKTTVQ